ncbi:hypothetical protein VV01_19160 [Luteipulveratus halotolerans]|uniref:Uncharacterized protein n=1 Tax=Luteipulveratus halotolerans TaxID=1631356 RepID=A0A0L6CM21_9MICO|nr:hypothetical protein VV01_19160 [Luteipulveratus halotolerans]
MATLVGGAVGQGLGVARAARAMNGQIDADLEFLLENGYLPNVQPVLPLTGSRPRSKVAIFLTSWAIGSLGIFVLIFLASVLVTAAANDPEHSVALAVVGGGLTGLGAGILGGWLPGLILFAILGTRENVRRAVGVVLEEFREYWEARTEAMHAIPQGRDPYVVWNCLATYRLPLDDA